MPRTYTCQLNAATLAANSGNPTDLFELTPADDKPIRILGLVIGQTSDVGDTNSENLGIKISRGFTATGSGGNAAANGVPLDPNDATSGFTFESNNTTVASSGTEAVLFSDVWNTQAGYQVWFPEGAQPQGSQANTLVTVRVTAPADAVTLSATVFVQEI